MRDPVTAAERPVILAPVAGAERIELLDILRGFALFGILLVNMTMFGAPIYLALAREYLWSDPLNVGVLLGIRFLAQGKFYTLFSLLFGVGFAIQYERAVARGRRPGRLFARRMLGLLLIGVIHAMLIWFGDILVLYAEFGFLLILFGKRKMKTLVIWTLVLCLLPVVFAAGMATVTALANADPEQRASAEQMLETQIRLNSEALDDALAAYGSGDWRRIQQQRAQDVLLLWTISLFFGWQVLGLFVLGLILGRLQVFRDLPRYLPWFRRWIWVLLTVGVLGNALAMFAEAQAGPPFMPDFWAAAGQLAQTIGGPALTFFYVAVIALLVQRANWRRRLRPLAAVGRMALSNYLLQSLICTAIFNGYGWRGLYGRVAPAWGLLLTLAIFLVQIPLSNAWLRRHRFGPMEWFWRSLTYGRLQPSRLRPPETAGDT